MTNMRYANAIVSFLFTDIHFSVGRKCTNKLADLVYFHLLMDITTQRNCCPETTLLEQWGQCLLAGL